MSKILEFKPKPPPPSMTNIFSWSDGTMLINGIPQDSGSSGYAGYVYETEPPEAG